MLLLYSLFHIELKTRQERGIQNENITTYITTLFFLFDDDPTDSWVITLNGINVQPNPFPPITLGFLDIGVH